MKKLQLLGVALLILLGVGAYIVYPGLVQKLETNPETDTPQSNTQPMVIEWGSSFGMCAGYCMTTMTLTGDTILLEYRSRDTEEPPLKNEFPLDNNLWEKLGNYIDEDVLSALPDQVGCPDCDDGGAEWIRITRGGYTKRIEFPYKLPPKKIAPLSEELRALLQDIAPRQE